MAYFAMSRLVLKWAFKRPATSRYPAEPRRVIPGSRGQLMFDATSCVFCSVCAKKCPTGALAVTRSPKKWSIDRLMCITCGYCVEACPKKSLELTSSHGSPAVTKDREFHGASASKPV